MKKTLLLCTTILLFWNCSEVDNWSDKKDSTPPGKITELEYKSLPGGARITYKLPNDDDILGVKAVYSFEQEGEIREAFSSAFRDTIELLGFPDTLERAVDLICIDKSRNESDPVTLIIKPSVPPVQLIRESLKLTPTFGGVYASWKNENNSDIAISVFISDSIGKMNLYDTFYSKITKGVYNFRGLSSKEQKIQVKIRDRWENYATTLDTVLTPFFEEEILSRNEFNQLLWSRYGWDDRSVEWRGDLAIDRNPWEILTDGITINKDSWWNSEFNYIYHFDSSFPKTQLVTPMYFTIDLGSVVNLSRHKLWMRGRNPGESYPSPNNRYFQFGAPKYYEVWGSEQPPKNPRDFSSKSESLAYWTEWPELDGNDSWKNDWIKLAECKNLPVSGAKTVDKLTVEDIIAADNGFEVEFDPALSENNVRYIRFVFKENWDKTFIKIHLVAIKFYGTYIK